MREKSRSKVPSVGSNKGHYGCPSCGCADATVVAEISGTAPVMFSDRPVAEPDECPDVDLYEDLELQGCDMSEYTCCKCGRPFEVPGYFVDGVNVPAPVKLILVCEQTGGEYWRQHLMVDGVDGEALIAAGGKGQEALIGTIKLMLTCSWKADQSKKEE